MDMHWLDSEYFGNTLRAWVIAAAVMAAAIIVLELVRGVAVRRLGRLGEGTQNAVDDLLVDLARRIRLFAIAAVALYLGTRFVVLPAKVGEFIGVLMTVALVVQAALWGNAIISFALHPIDQRRWAEVPRNHGERRR